MQPMEDPHQIEIRDIYGDDLRVLEPLLEQYHAVIPNPQVAMAKVAYLGERIVGFAVFQMVAHTEPLWVSPEYRGGELTRQLADSITEFARQAAGQFVCIATSSFVEALCREQRMDVVPGTMFVGRA